MWDYEKLFAEGNVVGLTIEKGKDVHNQVVSNPDYWNDGQAINWADYCNDNLSKDSSGFLFEIQYIIRLDEHGNVVEKLFDRERDIEPEPEPMPELKDGMFVKAYSPYRNESSFGLIYNNKVVYQNGEWDEIYDLTEDVVMEIYSAKALCFNSCQEPYLLWHNPKYQSN